MAIHEILGHTVPISANKKSPHVRGSIDSGFRDVCSNFPKMYGWFSWIQGFPGIGGFTVLVRSYVLSEKKLTDIEF